MENVNSILEKMSLDQKISIVSGRDFWNTRNIHELGIPSIMMTDGPHGLRKQMGTSDHLGLARAVPATCFPSGSALASSWDKELLESVGTALGKECRAEEVSVILGPGVNIKRSPLCGRNFEYYSEDPFLSSHMAKHFILGVQSQGIGTSLKHFAANNQEYKRMSIDTIVDERTLREIYLASFETAVKEGKPWTIMSAYNQLNGEFCSDNRRLLTEILRDEWGYEGLVVSDWGAEQDRVLGIKAGLDLEMPGNDGIHGEKIKKALGDGNLTFEELDKVCFRVLELVFKGEENRGKIEFSKEGHDEFAREVAGNCAVLLKNEEDILPIKKGESIAVIGELAVNPRYQGGGSSHINPTFIHCAKDRMISFGAEYARGYILDEDHIDDTLMDEALRMAQDKEKVVVFAGLPDRYESEGYDRKHMKIPANQSALIQKLHSVNENIIVVLANGSPIEMEWIQSAKAVLEGYLGGQAGALGIVDILMGEVNPSGKLTETFPVKIQHTPSFLFGTEGDKVQYKEGIYVGYRYFEKKSIEPLFPFGHGLSYTNFSYEDIEIDRDKIKDSDYMNIRVKVKNIGNRPGKEVVQLYVEDIETAVHRPVKELKGFEKVSLQPGEEKWVKFKLDKRAFAYYNVDIEDWHVESGDFNILLGSSSENIHLKRKVNVQSTVELKKKFTKFSTLKELMEHPAGKHLADALSDIFETDREKMQNEEDISKNQEEDDSLANSLTLNSLKCFGGITDEDIEGILTQLNS